LILRHAINNKLGLDALQSKVILDYGYTSKFVENVTNAIRAIGATLEYYKNGDYRKHKTSANQTAAFLVFMGCLVMLVGNLVSYQTRLDLAFGAFFILGVGLMAAAIYLAVLSREYILYTQLGADEYAKWRGLYNFLNSNTLINERTFVELAIWESYLVYATAFGVSKKVIKALKIRCPSTYTSPCPILGNPYFRSRSFYIHSGRYFRSATRRASFAARTGGGTSSFGSFSSGRGGWSGYGGGGRGGGGGGGGH